MQKALLFLLILCATSCEYFNAKKVDSEAILNEELKTFNWNDVDTYPTFLSCDVAETKTDKKACFENTLSQHITSSLQNETIIVTQDIEDTLVLEFQISEVGKITIKHIEINETTEAEIPNIKALLKESVNTLPKVFPAIKRNQPVKTEFKLPVIIAVN